MSTKLKHFQTAILSRRRFLETASGAVALTVLSPSGMGQAQTADGTVPFTTETPGVATQRIDGLKKVTGQKVFARDHTFKDMKDWKGKPHYAMYLRALTTEKVFKGIDRRYLPPAAKKARIILGNELNASQRSPQIAIRRDLLVDERIEEEAKDQPKTRGFDRPYAVVFDLIVQPGNVPDFLGQAVALLIFDDLAEYREASRAMAFQDDDFQKYGDAAPPKDPVVFNPKTTYVKYDHGGVSFDYANANPYSYPLEADSYKALIADALDARPDLLRHDFACDMRAMDPMFMEPESGLAWHDVENKTLNLVLGTQSPDGDFSDIVSMYRSSDAPFKLDAVVLTTCYPGGGFGGRDGSPFSLMLALASAFTDGNPVQLMYDRYEQFRVGLKRHATDLTGQVAIAPDMKLQNIEMNMRFDGGGRKNLSPYVASLAALCAGGSYKTPMANIYAEAVHSENISGGSQRGFGGPQAFFAIETALDDVAAGQGWDPVALRRANLIGEGDTTVTGGPVQQELRLREMLDRAEAHPMWADREALRDEYAARGLTYGTGLAMSLQAYGTSGDGMVAAITMDETGKLTVKSDAVDMGNGSATTLGVVIGPILGANAVDVEMGDYTLFADTELTTRDKLGTRWDNPDWTSKGVGSSSACLTGLHQVHVVQQTALALLEGSIMPAARILWGMPDLQSSATAWVDGALVLRDGGADPLPQDVLAGAVFENGLPRGTLGHAYFQAIWAEADYDTPGGQIHLALDGLSFYMPGADKPTRVVRQNAFGPAAWTRRFARYVWAPCVNVVGLTVDRGTGAVQVENVLSVLNAGRVHVPALVSGQSQGGVAMAISYALHEDLPPGMAGPANGTWNLDRYHVARAADVPLNTGFRPDARSQELIILDETPADKGAGRGIAEAVMCSVAPAISNALHDAVGVRYSSLPITPEKILKGLRA
ncbi:xanthine dehydrogenase family protein molybdopterin-binding subunit [Actibacterium lipolyticum]|uniref:Xanthine dehydrogenase molybdenum-binding subunit n=1 Tax=Actibacterium lipolyticum TaxID=1524263 RepID=A0A238KP56_9RHOB|nr:molybdopterin cofactor-binding domain-containing protein [Actibacterium lipolyticum]SMX44437.1 Xanthine dehydrogenase molybdenum-binding subunit [Actibacterium lipolyticum]